MIAVLDSFALGRPDFDHLLALPFGCWSWRRRNVELFVCRRHLDIGIDRDLGDELMFSL